MIETENAVVFPVVLQKRPQSDIEAIDPNDEGSTFRLFFSNQASSKQIVCQAWEIFAVLCDWIEKTR